MNRMTILILLIHSRHIGIENDSNNMSFPLMKGPTRTRHRVESFGIRPDLYSWVSILHFNDTVLTNVVSVLVKFCMCKLI